jgi:hypothetical protein
MPTVAKTFGISLLDTLTAFELGLANNSSSGSDRPTRIFPSSKAIVAGVALFSRTMLSSFEATLQNKHKSVELNVLL